MDLDMEIVSPAPDFNFKTISLGDPQPLNGHAGFYFTQLSVGNENKALCLQLPECVTKQGIVNIKNGKYLDLMFERGSNDELMRWVEQLEYTCQDIIDSKKDLWFQTELTRDDIETMMTQIARLYQSGKYMLMRVFMDTPNSKCIAYDENEIGFDLELLEANKPVIPLIVIEGVKFSTRSFEISLKLVQVMVMGKMEKKSTCLIKKKQQDLGDYSLEENSVVSAPAVVEPVSVIEKPMPVLEKAVPEPVLAKPNTVLAKPNTVLAKPNTVLAKPNTVLAKPNTVLAQPVLAQPAIKKNEIEEVTIDYDEVEDDSIFLKKPDEVYYELYKKAREKAKQCRIAAIEAYLEAKQIKTKYMLFDEDDSDDLSDDDIISDDEN
jgi:hypothetical protein